MGVEKVRKDDTARTFEFLFRFNRVWINGRLLLLLLQNLNSLIHKLQTSFETSKELVCAISSVHMVLMVQIFSKNCLRLREPHIPYCILCRTADTSK